MRRLVRSEGYVRARLVSGALFVILGGFVIYRTLGVTGLAGTAIPGTVLGFAMIALGMLRFRDYVRARRR